MKRILKILALALVYLIAGGRSCSDEEQASEFIRNKTLSEITDSIRLEMDTDDLPEHLLRAFELAAIQKLSDFTDYWQIVTDASLDTTFRKQAAVLARSLFINDDVCLNLRFQNDLSDELLPLDKLLNAVLNDQNVKSNFIIDSIGVEKPFTRISDAAFLGYLKFKINRPHGMLDHKVTIAESNRIEILLVKADKKLGGQTLKIWSVWLGVLK
ncbi:MAG: hypothetical protein U1C46_03475 [Bacteroidales bacterium]|nr:hypothetical protein [Bacteroidales bacterium]